MTAPGSPDVPRAHSGTPVRQELLLPARYALEGVEVKGIGVTTVLEAFSSMHALSDHLFHKVGLSVQRTPEGEWRVDPEQRYALSVYLRLLYEIRRLVGEIGLRAVGATLARLVDLPPGPGDIVSTLERFDDIYYLNHWKEGKRTLDVATGRRSGGLGHFEATGTGERSMRMLVSTPYPCAFVWGLLEDGIARTFSLPNWSVRHEQSECRERGAPACHYALSW